MTGQKGRFLPSNMKKITKIALKLLVLAVLVSPFLVVAQTTPSPIVNESPITQVGQVNNIIVNIVRWMIYIFWVFAVGFFIWAAFLYLTAGGDEEKVKLARQKVVTGLIAAAIALLATGIRAIVLSFLQSGGGGGFIQ